MKTRRNKLPPRPVQALLGGLFLTLASQVSISLFQSDFRISAGVMLLPVFVFLAPGCPVFYTALVGGAGTVLLRAALHGQQGTFAAAVAAYAPEFLFFALYGALLAGYLRLVKLRPFRWRVMLPVVCIDFASNLVELAVRLGTGVLNWRVLAGIFAAALCRTLFTAVMLWALDAYGVAILRREDSERYRRLLLMTSSLEGERVLLRRNAIVMFMCVELMLNAANLAFVTFSRMNGHLDGQAIALFVMAVAAAEVVVGLAIIMAIFRARRSASVDAANLLKL